MCVRTGYHHQNGPVPVSWFANQPIAEKIIEAAETVGYRFNVDYNGEHQEGKGDVFRLEQKICHCFVT